MKVEVGKKFVLRNIFFETDKSILTPKSYEELNNLLKILNDNPNMRIEISGHTDIVGGAAYNMRLSDARAKAVVDYLISNGIKLSRMEWKGIWTYTAS